MKYNVDPIKAILSKDRDIIYYEYQKNDKQYILFMDLFLKKYRESKKYFMKTMHNPVFAMYRNYFGLTIFLIIFQAIMFTLNEYNISCDLFNERQLENMFISCGIDSFKELPNDYRIKIIKNIININKKNGTEIFTEILNIFKHDIEGISLMKYLLVKDFRRDNGFNYDPIPSYNNDDLELKTEEELNNILIKRKINIDNVEKNKIKILLKNFYENLKNKSNEELKQIISLIKNKKEFEFNNFKSNNISKTYMLYIFDLIKKENIDKLENKTLDELYYLCEKENYQYEEIIYSLFSEKILNEVFLNSISRETFNENTAKEIYKIEHEYDSNFEYPDKKINAFLLNKLYTNVERKLNNSDIFQTKILCKKNNIQFDDSISLQENKDNILNNVKSKFIKNEPIINLQTSLSNNITAEEL